MEASVRPGPRSGLPVLLSFIFPDAMPTPLSLSFPSYVFLVYPCRFHRVTSLSRSSLTHPSSRSPFLSFIRAPCRYFSLPFAHAIVFFAIFLYFILDPFHSPPTIPFSRTDGDSSLSNCFPVPNCYSPGRNGNYPGILFLTPVLAKLSFRIIH